MSIHAIAVPMCTRMLGSLSKLLDKGAAFAEAKKFDPSVLLTARLAPDMYSLTRQVQSASDSAKGGCARLAGVDIPAFPDDETTFDELKARIAKTIDFVSGLDAKLFDGAEQRPVVLKMRAGEVTFSGQSYLVEFFIPNFTFHCATAYDILRHNGVEIGKRDFLGLNG